MIGVNNKFLDIKLDGPVYEREDFKSEEDFNPQHQDNHKPFLDSINTQLNENMDFWKQRAADTILQDTKAKLRTAENQVVVVTREN